MESNLTEEQRKFPIWLIGDSYPSSFISELNSPFDSRHPTRHTIWTPIWDAMQESVYPRRIDGQHLFICNAAGKQIEGKPNKNFDDDDVKKRISKFTNYLNQYKPVMVLCFGAWAYEFVRRADPRETVEYSHKHWKIPEIAKAFLNSYKNFQPNAISIFPLLHQIVALKWERANKEFVLDNSGNDYFRYTGEKLGSLLKTHACSFEEIWRKVP